MRNFGLGLLVVLSGCAAHPGIYAEIGAGYKLERTTSAVLRPDCHTVTGVSADGPRSCGGDNPTAHLVLGHEWRNGVAVELNHWSHFNDGGADRETHKDEIVIKKRWGGHGVYR